MKCSHHNQQSSKDEMLKVSSSEQSYKWAYDRTHPFSAVQSPFTGIVAQNSTSDIFAKCIAEKGDGNLFSTKPNSINLFVCPKVDEKYVAQPPSDENTADANLEDENSGTIESLPDTMQSIIAPNKGKLSDSSRKSEPNFKEDRSYIKLCNIKVKKFRAGEKPLINDVDVSVEKPLDNEGWLALIARDQRTRRLLYQAVVLPECAEITEFMQKAENIKVNAWRAPAQTPNILCNFVKQVVKMQVQVVITQLDDSRDAERFRSAIEKEKNRQSQLKEEKGEKALHDKEQSPPEQVKAPSSTAQNKEIKFNPIQDEDESVDSNLTSPPESEHRHQSGYPTITVIPPPEDFPICRR